MTTNRTASVSGLKPDDVIQLISMPEDPDALPAGATGRVTHINPVRLGGRGFDQVTVKWDAPHEHRTLMLSVPPDRVAVVGRVDA